MPAILGFIDHRLGAVINSVGRLTLSRTGGAGCLSVIRLAAMLSAVIFACSVLAVCTRLGRYCPLLGGLLISKLLRYRLGVPSVCPLPVGCGRILRYVCPQARDRDQREFELPVG